MFAALNNFFTGSAFSPLSLAPLAWYDLSNPACYGGTGTTLTDLSGNANNGTLTTGATYSATDGGIVNLNGSTGNIRVTPIESGAKLSNKTGFCFAGFVKHTNVNTGLFNYSGASQFATDILNYYSASSFATQINQTVDGQATTARTYSPAWYHYAVVFDGSQTGNANRLKVYVNGALQTLSFGSYTVPSATGVPTSPLCSIGAFIALNAWFLNGSVASALIFDKAITATDVTNIFNHGKTRLGL